MKCKDNNNSKANCRIEASSELSSASSSMKDNCSMGDGSCKVENNSNQQRVLKKKK